MGQARSREASEIDAHVGLRLRKLRQERGLTLKELAQAMGHTSGQAVSKYEQGAAFPAALMYLTCEALGVPVSAFFEGLGGRHDGVDEEAAPFLADELGDSTESRKIATLLRGTPAPQHPLILKVVRVLASAGPTADGGEG